MKALAIFPYRPEFEAVFRSMQRACERFSNDSRSNSQSTSADLTHVICESIDQTDGATFDIVKKLLEAIRSCDFCIADLTGTNTNVLYELGFAMALEKPVILLTQDITTLPFDLRGLNAIQYDRDNLDKTLELRLTTAVHELSKHIARVPTLSLHAKSLALTSASATYFLDADYRIHYMNEAAADLFATSRFGGGKSWIDSTLREFINDISHHLDNLPAIEKNLQVQTEEVRRLEAAGKPLDVPDYNIEPIILNSPEYGKLELQKTGVAVRDPSTGRITGWVVSFNVVQSHEPCKYKRFHEKHRDQVKALLQRTERTSQVAYGREHSRCASDRPLWPDSPGIERWIRGGCTSPHLHIATGYAEKQSCFDFCVSVMTGDTRRYGLESVRFLDEWFFDFHNAEYILMRTPDGDLVGVFRLHTNRDVIGYKDIAEWVIRAAEDDQAFADVGAYLHPAIDGPPRAACLAKLLGRAARIAERNQQVYLYCQVPSHLERFFDGFLFEKAGRRFRCPGWRQPSWTPYAVKCMKYSDEGDTDGWNEADPKSGPESGLEGGLRVAHRVSINYEFVNTAREEYVRERATESIV